MSVMVGVTVVGLRDAIEALSLSSSLISAPAFHTSVVGRGRSREEPKAVRTPSNGIIPTTEFLPL